MFVVSSSGFIGAVSRKMSNFAPENNEYKKLFVFCLELKTPEFGYPICWQLSACCFRHGGDCRVGTRMTNPMHS